MLVQVGISARTSSLLISPPRQSWGLPSSGMAKRWIEDKMPRIGYDLGDGTIVEIPYLPVERAGIPIPGWVTKPEGKKVFVFLLEYGVEQKTDAG
ncbi:MAG: hypothetical protein D0531_00395 [Methylococcales bacterium]|nr:MAG: hypothetical protein D0531_00395 [Methylococcales bacterium]